MKKLAVLILILPFISFEAHALKSLGVVNCEFGPSGPCQTVSAVEDFGIATISKRLKCDPNKGACSVVKGEEYIIRVDVYDHSVCKVFHYHVRGTAFNKPAVNHFAIFRSVESTYSSTCSNHDHPCQGGGGDPK